jgi:hypothetical protein
VRSVGSRGYDADRRPDPMPNDGPELVRLSHLSLPIIARDELLNDKILTSLKETPIVIEQWRKQSCWKEKGWKTAQDFVAAAKRKPGSINYGSTGLGTATHISAERFRLAAGIEATHVPYKGGAEALSDLLGGRIDFYFCPISTALPYINDGRVLPLLVSTPTRASDVPTPRDAGFVNADTIVWYAVFMQRSRSAAVANTVRINQNNARAQVS